MTEIKMLTACPRDVQSLDPRLCEMDKLERGLAFGENARDILERTLQMSISAYTLHINKRAEAMCGLIPLADMRNAVIWCVSSAAMHNYPRQYMRYGRWLTAEGLANFNLLQNYVYENNAKSIAWLERLGAKFERPQPYGVSRAMFRRFTICA